MGHKYYSTALSAKDIEGEEKGKTLRELTTIVGERTEKARSKRFGNKAWIKYRIPGMQKKTIKQNEYLISTKYREKITIDYEFNS